MLAVVYRKLIEGLVWAASWKVGDEVQGLGVAASDSGAFTRCRSSHSGTPRGRSGGSGGRGSWGAFMYLPSGSVRSPGCSSWCTDLVGRSSLDVVFESPA